MSEQRLAELEELATARPLTDDEQRELDGLREGARITGLKLTKTESRVTGLELRDTSTGEVVVAWKPEQE